MPSSTGSSAAPIEGVDAGKRRFKHVIGERRVQDNSGATLRHLEIITSADHAIGVKVHLLAVLWTVDIDPVFDPERILVVGEIQRVGEGVRFTHNGGSKLREFRH